MNCVCCPACAKWIPCGANTKVVPVHGMGHRWGVCPGSGSRPVQDTPAPTTSNGEGSDA